MSNKKILRRYDPILLRILPPVGAFFVKSLLNTCSIVGIEGEDHPEPVLYVSWHQRMSFFARHLAERHPVIMISQSRDGEYGRRFAEQLGFGYVRGSSSKGGIKALRDIINHLKGGKSAGILADGPLGPPRIAKIGPIIIARESKVPIVPIVWGCSRFCALSSWDRYLIPRPFSRIVIRYGDPIFVPADARSSKLEFYRKKLQDILNRCTRWCDDYFGVTVPWKKEE